MPRVSGCSGFIFTLRATCRSACPLRIPTLWRAWVSGGHLSIAIGQSEEGILCVKQVLRMWVLPVTLCARPLIKGIAEREMCMSTGLSLSCDAFLMIIHIFSSSCVLF